MSPVFRVTLSPRFAAAALGVPPGGAVLKLFDRRSLTNAREEYRGPGAPAAHDADKERAYKAFHASAQPPLDFDDPWSVHARVAADDGALEAYLAYCASHMYAAERTAYARLRGVQGALVPECFGAVTYELADGEAVHGLLLEHIPARSLHDVVARHPPHEHATLRALCDAAVACVRRTARAGFLDEDVRPDNLLVRDGACVGAPEVVLVDLADGQVRGAQGDAAWAALVTRADPAAALGRALEALVKECAGDGVWRYEAERRKGRPEWAGRM